MSPFTRRMHQATSRRPDTPTPPPSSGVKPDATNTGPRAGHTLTLWSGDYYMLTDGETLNDTHVTGNVYMGANNLTISDCIIDGAAQVSNDGTGYMVPVKQGATIQHSVVVGVYAVGYHDLTVDYCHLGNQTDTFMEVRSYYTADNTYLEGTNLTITNSLFDTVQASPANAGKHLNCIQIISSTNILVRNSVFDWTAPDAATLAQTTSAFLMEPVMQGVSNDTWWLDGCWFYGGGYYQFEPYGTNGKVTNCMFNTNPNGDIEYPPAQVQPQPFPYFAASGNTLDGAPYTLPGAA